MTCHFRCGNACDHPEPNRSDNGQVQDEITKAVQRRSVLRGAAAAPVTALARLPAPARPGPPFLAPTVGYVLELTPGAGDHAGTSISCPDNVAFNDDGTCGSPPTATRSAP